MIYIVSILFTLCFVMYSKYQFEDRKPIAKNKWHVWGLIMRGLVFLPFIGNISWPDLLLAISLCALLFELLINKIALNVGWFYVGGTAKFDIVFKKYKWLLMFIFLSLAIILKILNP